MAWKDSQLLQGITEISPEARLEALILVSLEKGFMDIHKGDSEFMSAASIQEKLFDRDSPTCEQAKSLLKFDANCGSYLSRLHRKGSEVIVNRKLVKGITKYEISNGA